ncbi:MAG: LamG-like jellyroll fold domain-containing protein [Candidatus Aquilonibacter sp.]
MTVASLLALAGCGGGGHSEFSPPGVHRSLRSSNADDYSTIVLADAPSAYYRLDDTGSTAFDLSGNGINGAVGLSVVTNSAGLLLSSSDAAMAFPGVATAAGTVRTPQATMLQPASAVSLEAWLQFANVPATFAVAAGYGSDSSYAPYDLFFRSGGTLVAQFYTSGGVLEVPSPTALRTNTTYHVVSTFDGTTGILYVNGVNVASVTKSGTLSGYVPGLGFAIGDDASLGDPAFAGTIDEVAVYAGKALTAQQILNHYIAGTSGGITPPPTPTPVPSNSPGSDWTTMGYDLQRTGYNPNEHTIGTSNISSIKSYWAQSAIVPGGEIGEPVLASSVIVNAHATNVIYAGSGSGVAIAFNADTRTKIWSRQLGFVTYVCGSDNGEFGANGTPVIDRSTNRIYFADGRARVHALDLSTGAEAAGWPVQIATPANHNFIYSGLTFNPANGILYVETSSTCDISPWYGRITAINGSSARKMGTFFPTQGKSGGGIWGFGGASVDPATNDVYIATGNADGSNQSAYYAEQIVALTPDVRTVVAHSYATLPPSSDSDYGATPLLFQPPGCPPLLAAVNKSGLFVLFNRTNINAGPMQTIAMSIATGNGDFIGIPAYDPVTNYVYLGLPATFGIYRPGAGAFSVQSDCTLNPTPVWNAAFGADGAVLTGNDTPRSPITIANGVLYVSDFVTSTTFAFDAASGAQLWTSPLNGNGIVGPIVINGHLYTGDISGRLNAWAP